MTDPNLAAFNMNLMDPNALEEPKETFPVVVATSRMRWSSPAYNAANSFRQAFPYRTAEHGPEGNSIQQWNLVLQRLDAVYYHEDGSPFTLPNGGTAQTVPVTVYAGLDLEKMDKHGVVKGIMKTRGKEPFILGAWTKVAGSLTPDPSVIEGKMFIVERFREKEIAPGYFAKNIIIPVEALAPTYVYSGDVLRFKAGRQDEVASTEGAVAGTSTLSKDEVAAKLISYLNEIGVSPTDVKADLLNRKDFPTECRANAFISAIATGQLVELFEQLGVEV